MVHRALSLFPPAQWVVWITAALGDWCEDPAQPPAPLGADAWFRGAERPWLHPALLWKHPAVAGASDTSLDTSLERDSLLITHGSKLQACQTMKARLLVTGSHWCCKRGRGSSGLVTTMWAVHPRCRWLTVLATVSSLCCLFLLPLLQSSGLVLLVWKAHVLIVLLTKHSAVRSNSLEQTVGIRSKA